MLGENQILALLIYSSEAGELAKLLNEYPLYVAPASLEAVKLLAMHWELYKTPPKEAFAAYLTEQNAQCHRSSENVVF